MKPKFNITVNSFKSISEIEKSWTIQDYRNLLELFDQEVGEIDDKEVFEYLALAMLDLEPEESAEIVLKYKLGDKLNENQFKQVAHDMVEEPLWEEYQEMSLHEDLFIVNSLLYKGYNGKFPTPEAVILELLVESTNHDGKVLIEDNVCDEESFIGRVLATGMGEHSILNRLFDEQIAGDKFPEAEHIIWTMSSTLDGESVKVTVTTSEFWVRDLKGADSYETGAYSDKSVEDDD